MDEILVEGILGVRKVWIPQQAFKQSVAQV